jgi:hypothetical protein
VPIANKLKAAGAKMPKPKSTEPLWAGPNGKGPLGGVTQSLLQRFLVCRERFRLLVVEGLRPTEGFNHRMEYGNMWHACEEELARTKGADDNWERALLQYAKGLAQEYKTQQSQVEHWYNVCKTQFPIYVDFWAKHKDVKNRTPLLQEGKFDVQYRLPSGRTVRLRGKWDSVDLIGPKGKERIFLQENKAKGEVDEQALRSQLQFDLQTMMYLVALNEYQDESFWRRANKSWRNKVIAGVRYNVIRRPLSGGKGNIKQLSPTKKNPTGETKEEYYKRLGDYIRAEPETYFMRWEAIVSSSDIQRFEQQCFQPILEQLCDWWEWIRMMPDNPFASSGDENYNGIHWRHPFGVYNVLNEGGSSDLDQYLATGSELGLERATTLFRELE